MTIKLAKNGRFWGIDINVFMGHLSTLPLSLVLVVTDNFLGQIWDTLEIPLAPP